MRLQTGYLALIVLSSGAIAQAPELRLRGDRFKPLTYDKLNAEQKTMVEHLFAGERGGTNGPFNVTLRSPEMGDMAQKLGAVAIPFLASEAADRAGHPDDRTLLERAVRVVGAQKARAGRGSESCRNRSHRGR